MSRYLSYRVINGSCAIAICDRCKKKMYLGELKADGDAPGLRVCDACNDEVDPYTKPAIHAEKIELKYPRPDEELV